MTPSPHLKPSPLPAPWFPAIFVESVVNTMTTFALCDDQPQMLRELERRLSGYLEARQPFPYRINCFSSGRSLLECEHSFDVILLDIQMARPDGMETARRLRQRGSHSLVIFVTVLADCVFDSFEVEASGYLLKPVEEERFRKTLDRVLGVLARRREGGLLVRRGSGQEVVPLEELFYCEVQGRKVYLHLAGGRVIDYYQRMEQLEREVDRRFFRCHRSYLVNLDYVRGCGGGQVTLPGEERVPVSRLRERELAQALLRHMKERGV